MDCLKHAYVIHFKRGHKEDFLGHFLNCRQIKIEENLAKVFSHKLVSASLHFRKICRIDGVDRDVVLSEQLLNSVCTVLVSRVSGVACVIIKDDDLEMLREKVQTLDESHPQVQIIQQLLLLCLRTNLSCTGWRLKDLMPREVRHDSVELNDQKSVIHHSHSSCKELSLCPLILLRGRGQQLNALITHRSGIISNRS